MRSACGYVPAFRLGARLVSPPRAFFLSVTLGKAPSRQVNVFPNTVPLGLPRAVLGRGVVEADM